MTFKNMATTKVFHCDSASPFRDLSRTPQPCQAMAKTAACRCKPTASCLKISLDAWYNLPNCICLLSMSALPSLLLSPEKTIAMLRLELALAEQLVISGTEPPSLATALGSQHNSTIWSRDIAHKINALFSEDVVAVLEFRTPNGTRPKLDRLREIIEALESQYPPSPPPPPQPDVLDLERIALHPKLLEYCKDDYCNGSYDNAVLNAFKLVETEVRARSGAQPDDLGTDLMSLTFNPKKPRLVLSNISAEQEGCHLLFRAAIALFKNPLSHRFVNIDDQHRAFELLTFASLLLHLLDECRLMAPQLSPP